MKPQARESFKKQLGKVIQEEKIDIELEQLPDKELKELYLKLQAVRSGMFPYAVKKGQVFKTSLENNDLQRVSFSDTYKYGVRRLTFKEYLQLCDYVKDNPGTYTALNGLRF